MKDNALRKGLVYALVVLFIGASIIPLTGSKSVSKSEEKFYTPTSSRGYIQDAIDAAIPGSTVFIPSGIYYEHVVIDKQINLIGEDRNTTIIDGGGTGWTTSISADGVTISGFTIQNGDNGVAVAFCSDSKVINCTISNNTGDGVHMSWRVGTGLTVSRCTISHNNRGIYALYAPVFINRCTISHNSYGAYLMGLWYEDPSEVYYNNFINNTVQAYDSHRDRDNNPLDKWDYGYPPGGNYWSDFDDPSEGAYDNYSGINQDELGSDGIVDAPYDNTYGCTHKDRYPLMEPWNGSYIPSDPKPRWGATDVSIDADLSWVGGDPDGDPWTYDVYFGTTSPPPLVSPGQSETTYDPGTMLYDTTYYWQIVAWDNHGNSTSGPIWDFITEIGPTIVSIQPSTTNVEQGEAFEVSIWVYPGEPIAEIYFEYLYFNATLLYVNHLRLDGFFDPYDTWYPMWPEVDNVNGYIKNFYEGIMGPGSVTSNGSWLTINFTAQNQNGVSLLELDNVWIFNEYLEPVPTTINNGSVTVTTPPEITNVMLTTSDPLDTEPNFGWENITCTVTDNIAVATVKLAVTNDTATVEYPMANIPETDCYYCNTTFTQPGDYSYHIWANDTSGNIATSSPEQFALPMNEDVDMNGQAYFEDLIAIVMMYGDTGPPGWIREDVNNDGKVYFDDLMDIIRLYGEEW